MPDSKATIPVEIEVLLVEDDKSMYSLLNQILKMPPPATVKLSWEDTVRKGLEVAKATNPQAILLDLVFLEPEPMAATETIKLIPEFAKIAPVIVITGNGTESRWMETINAGAKCFLQKDIYLRPDSRGFLLHSITNAIFLDHAERRAATQNA